MAKAEMTEAVKALGITMETVFVPFSQSRHKTEKTPSLNWRVQLAIGARTIITTDYTQGSGHCIMPKGVRYGTDAHRVEVTRQTESGRTFDHGRVSAPAIEDVLYCLMSDTGALDYATFEDWAENLGYDPDSRSAEKIYRDCLGVALKFRAALGEDGMAKIRDASQDF